MGLQVEGKVVSREGAMSNRSCETIFVCLLELSFGGETDATERKERGQKSP